MRKKKTEDMLSEHESGMLDVLAGELKETKAKYLKALSAMTDAAAYANEIHYIDKYDGKIQSAKLSYAKPTAYGTFECIRSDGNYFRTFDLKSWGETWAFSEYMIKKALSAKLSAEAEAKRKREEDAKIAKKMAESIKNQFGIDDERLSELAPYLSKGA